MYRLFLFSGIIAISILSLSMGAAWYAPAVAAFGLCALLPVWRRGAFYFSFLGCMLVWGCYAGYLHLDSAGALGDRLAVTFGVASGWVMVLITGIWGGLTAGLGGWLGASARIAVATANK